MPLPELVRSALGYPMIPSKVYMTASGTRYLKHPGVAVYAVQRPDHSALNDFLSGFDEGMHFGEYLTTEPDMPPGERICKTAGQVCYLSFGRGRTKDPVPYLEHIIESGHGSVLQHAVVTFQLYGLSRSLTHELVRHGTGTAYSQLSQRYVDKVRFVERPNYQHVPSLHELFEQRIDRERAEYEDLCTRLIAEETERRIRPTDKEGRTQQRKRVREAARSCLPNEAETSMVMTANVRAWRHIIEMRGAAGAEIEIRILAEALYRCLVDVAPILFDDYTLDPQHDGTYIIDTQFRKV